MEPAVTDRLVILYGVEGYPFSEPTPKWRYAKTDRDMRVVDGDGERTKAEEHKKNYEEGERGYSGKEEKSHTSANYQ